MGFTLNTDFSGIAPDEGGNAKMFFPVSDSRGWLCQIVSSEGKETNAKNGTYLALVLSGLEGPVQGKTMDWQVNIANPSQKAVEIGMGQLSAVAHVTGHVRVGSSAEWHNKPFRVVVAVDTTADLEKYPNSTRITKILDVNGNGPKDAGKGVMGAAQGQQAAAFGGQAQPQQQAPAQAWAGQQQQPQGQSGGNFTQAQGQGQPIGTTISPSEQQFQPPAGGAPQFGGQQAPAQQFQDQPQGGQQLQQPAGGAGPGWNQ